ncbi:hypothetical protein L9F63_025088, partial [Diploptera punctata]
MLLTTESVAHAPSPEDESQFLKDLQFLKKNEGTPARYTYGKSVEGEATVTVYPTYYSGLLQPIFQNPVLQIDVAVEEALTGRRQNTTFEVMLHRYKYKMEMIKTSEYFKPGLKCTVFVTCLSRWISSAGPDNAVTIRYGFTYDQNLYVEERHKLSKDGLIELNFYPPIDSNQTVLGIETKHEEWFSTVSSALSPSNTFIQAVLVTQNPTVNQDIELDVNCTEPMTQIPFKAYNKKTHRLRFLATYAMAHNHHHAHVVCIYMREDGEVVADAIDIELDEHSRIFLIFKINVGKNKSGGNVEMTVEAKPNSYVGLLGIDQSVLLLKSGNEYNKRIVAEELKSYDKGSEAQFWPPMMNFRERDPQIPYWWVNNPTLGGFCFNSGSVILTNGLVHEYFPQATWRDFNHVFAAGGIGGPVTMSSPEPIRVRRNFPETWLWQMLEAGYKVCTG